LAQFTRDWPKDTSATRVIFLADDHRCVVIEANMRAIRTDKLFRRSHDNRTHDFALLHRTTRRSYLYRRDDHIAHEAVAHARATQNSDAHDLFRAGVVGHLESRLLLNHGYLSSPRLTI